MIRAALPPLALLALLCAASPAFAAEGPGRPVAAVLANGYWDAFVDYWVGLFRKQDSIVMIVLGLGALGIFIITRGKWKK